MANKQISESELSKLIKQLNLDDLDVNSKIEKTYNENFHDHILAQDGSIQIKGNKIIVQDPIDGGNLPVISSIAPVKLVINNVVIESETTVTSSDRIQWEIEEKPLFDIKVSDDKLTAYFQLYSKERCAWRLVSTEPLHKIIIAAEKDEHIVFETVHLGDVASVIEQKSIRTNVEFAAIQQELIQPTYQPIAIARGKAATSGRDSQLEVYFSEQVENQFFESAGTIDFRNHLHIPSVKKGELIAKKIPMVDGIPGYDVYMNVIMPVPPKDVFVIVKSNAGLNSNGEIVALKEGRPRITGDRIKVFDISTSYIVPSDVDIETGNIVFSGDVIVYGDVTDSMIVESLGNVYVYGNIYNATITATGSIHIRGNVIGSKLYSGYFGVMFNRLYNSSRMLSELLEKLLAAAGMLEQALETRKQTVRFGQIVQLLLENKLKEIPSVIKELLFVISNIQHLKKEEYQKLKDMSEMFFRPSILIEAVSYDVLQSFLALLRETHLEVARMQEDKAHIMINQCHNSELKSNGDIIIQRDGVLLSDLYSAGNILFQHELAVCRGAKLEAGGGIAAKIVGGQMGANTILRAKRQITVKKMYAGRVCVGRYCMDVFEEIEDKIFNSHNMKQRA